MSWCVTAASDFRQPSLSVEEGERNCDLRQLTGPPLELYICNFKFTGEMENES